MNPLYNMLTGRQQMPVQNAQNFSPPQFPNPIQKLNYIMQAMRNPAAFVKQNIPGIPDQILNDPNMILRYMQEHCGVTQEDIQRAASQIPRF